VGGGARKISEARAGTSDKDRSTAKRMLQEKAKEDAFNRRKRIKGCSNLVEGFALLSMGGVPLMGWAEKTRAERNRKHRQEKSHRCG